ncbi:MAG: hypothetical protein GXN98_02070 [Euryarchaeota archaeon]|nr:hypothetical protein [Euryarchaeota archaeon]
MLRSFIKRKDVKELLKELDSPLFEGALSPSDRVERVRIDQSTEAFLVEGSPVVFRVRGYYLPALRWLVRREVRRCYVVVDEGAAERILRGAHVMRPGVVEYDPEIEAFKPVAVLMERSRRAIAVGVSEWSGAEYAERTKGRCVLNLHYAGDSLWRLEL